MNLFDLIDDAAPAPPQLPPVTVALRLEPGDRVRTTDGRRGRVVLFVPATDRVAVRFNELELPSFVHRIELERVAGPCMHRWENGETVWPGESSHRLTKTCRDCGEVRGRVR